MSVTVKQHTEGLFEDSRSKMDLSVMASMLLTVLAVGLGSMVCWLPVRRELNALELISPWVARTRHAWTSKAVIYPSRAELCYAARVHSSPCMWMLLTGFFLEVDVKVEGPVLPAFDELMTHVVTGNIIILLQEFMFLVT